MRRIIDTKLIEHKTYKKVMKAAELKGILVVLSLKKIRGSYTLEGY